LRRRYIGGISTITGCADGDCTAIDVLDAIVDLLDGADPAPRRTRRGSPRQPSARFALPDFEEAATEKPRKRKRSKYQMEFGRQLKALKRKHPRTAVTKLMSRAHALTRKKLGMKRRRK